MGERRQATSECPTGCCSRRGWRAKAKWSFARPPLAWSPTLGLLSTRLQVRPRHCPLASLPSSDRPTTTRAQTKVRSALPRAIDYNPTRGILLVGARFYRTPIPPRGRHGWLRRSATCRVYGTRRGVTHRGPHGASLGPLVRKRCGMERTRSAEARVLKLQCSIISLSSNRGLGTIARHTDTSPIRSTGSRERRTPPV